MSESPIREYRAEVALNGPITGSSSHWSSTQAHGQIESDLWRLELGPNDERIRKNVDPQNAILSEETFKLSTPLFLGGVFDIVQVTCFVF